MSDRYRDTIEAGESVALSLVQEPNTELFVDWNPYIGHDWDAPGDTRVAQADFQRVAAKLEELPNGFVLHRQVSKILDDRHRMAAGAKPVNWGMAEIMAYATLVDAGLPPERLAAVGMGEFQPLIDEATPEAYAQNRRIELQFR